MVFIFVFPLTVLLLLEVQLGGCAQVDSVGCYSLIGLPVKEDPILKLKLFTCVDHCRKEQNGYIAYKPSSCHCVYNLTDLRVVDSSHCNYTCVEDKQLRCGGQRAISVFSTEPVKTEEPPWVFHPLAMGLVAVVLLVLVAIGVFFFRQWKSSHTFIASIT